MSRCVPVVLALAFLAAGASAQEGHSASAATPEPGAAASPTNIQGVWKVTELASRVPGAEWEVSTPSLSQFVFTAKHYSYMYVPGAGPRKAFAGDPNRPTDAEKVEAYNSFIAASGSYLLSGRTLALSALIHKNPNEVGGKPLTYTVAFDGNTLRMVIANPPFSPGRERRIVLTRIE